MPLKSIHLQNFQSHEDTTLELSEGMNVIWGPSDNGKSSIIRGTRLVVSNRPQGEDFRRHDTKKTQVTIEKDKFNVQRRRTDSKNEYELNGQIYKALRTSVPEDIFNALNLTETNIQSQHEVYFLIDKSPGQRSKILNEVAGLEIMDKIISRTNSDIRSINSDIKHVTAELRDDQTNILQLEWVKEADAFLKKLENYQASIEKKEDFHETVMTIVTAIENVEKEKEKLMSDKCIKTIDSLIKEEEHIKRIEEKLTKITNLVDRIEATQKKLDSITVIDVSELEKLQDKIDSLQEKYERVSEIIEEIKFKETQNKQIKSKIAETEDAFNKELKKLGKCPTCGKET